MNRKLAILLSLVLASGCAVTDDEDYGYDRSPTGTPSGDPATLEPDIQGEGVGPTFAEVDADGDGLISEDEAANYEAVADNFQFVDEDNDGYLSDVEYMDLKE